MNDTQPCPVCHGRGLEDTCPVCGKRPFIIIPEGAYYRRIGVGVLLGFVVGVLMRGCV